MKKTTLDGKPAWEYGKNDILYKKQIEEISEDAATRISYAMAEVGKEWTTAAVYRMTNNDFHEATLGGGQTEIVFAKDIPTVIFCGQKDVLVFVPESFKKDPDAIDKDVRQKIWLTLEIKRMQKELEAVMVRILNR